jgi:hypothetical protein
MTHLLASVSTSSGDAMFVDTGGIDTLFTLAPFNALLALQKAVKVALLVDSLHGGHTIQHFA